MELVAGGMYQAEDAGSIGKQRHSIRDVDRKRANVIDRSDWSKDGRRTFHRN